jgi:transcriptional regulator with XRE-family HTH domain
MQFANTLSDDTVAKEIGRRIAAARIERQMTQALFAAAAGVSKRSIERLEDGTTAQLSNFIRCLRVLDKLEGLERLLPETPPNPITLLKSHRAPRSRARPPKRNAISATAATKPVWVWGDEK